MLYLDLEHVRFLSIVHVWLTSPWTDLSTKMFLRVSNLKQKSLLTFARFAAPPEESGRFYLLLLYLMHPLFPSWKEPGTLPTTGPQIVRTSGSMLKCSSSAVIQPLSSYTRPKNQFANRVLPKCQFLLTLGSTRPLNEGIAMFLELQFISSSQQAFRSCQGPFFSDSFS